MKNSSRRILFAMLCVVIFSTNASAAEEQILKIRKAYESIKDIKGSFIQKNIIKSLNKTDTYKGDFFIKYPLKMKWTYKGKAAQDVTISDSRILIYKKGDKQAYRGAFDKYSYGQTPIALLSGFGDITEEFTITGKNDTLILKPKSPMGTITSMKLVLSDGDFPIRSFTIYDGNLNIVEIELKEVSVNTGLQDSLFDMSLPKGVSVFEQNP